VYSEEGMVDADSEMVMFAAGRVEGGG